MDSLDNRRKSEEMSEEMNETVISNEEVLLQQKDHSIKKSFSTLKEENDKLRTYLGLVKMCNNSAINKIKSAINETMDSINSANGCESHVIIKQLEIIQNEISNMQSMHTKLEEGIEAFQLIDNNVVNTHTNDDHMSDHNRDNTVVVVTARYEVPRKSTGIRKSTPNKSSNKSKAKASKESSMNTKLLNRIVDNKSLKGVIYVDSTEANDVCNEEQEAVANIDNMSSSEERENVSQVSDELITSKAPKKPYISEEFKSSHLQRLVEAKRRREEMNKQLEREGKRKPKTKKSEEHMREVTEFGKKTPKKRQTKKKTVGKGIKKKILSQPITTAQSIVVPISQTTLDSLNGQTIQIISAGGTQILCRNDGTFIPSNSAQWQTTTNTQWTTADATNNYNQNQWTQYQS